MPLYGYRCSAHGDFDLFHPVPPGPRGPKKCPQCAALSRPIVCAVMSSTFRPYTEWNIDSTGPVAITSAAQLDRECDKRGLRVVGGGGLPRAEQRRIEEHHASFHKMLARKKRHG